MGTLPAGSLNEYNLMLSILIGIFGMAYAVYGKKRPNGIALFAGIAMCLFPYFISDILWELFLFALCLSLPFVIRI